MAGPVASRAGGRLAARLLMGVLLALAAALLLLPLQPAAGAPAAKVRVGRGRPCLDGHGHGLTLVLVGTPSFPPQTADAKQSEMAKVHRRKQSHGVVPLDDGTYDVRAVLIEMWTRVMGCTDWLWRGMFPSHGDRPTQTQSIPTSGPTTTALRDRQAPAVPPDGALHGALGEVQLPHLPVGFRRKCNACICVDGGARAVTWPSLDSSSKTTFSPHTHKKNTHTQRGGAGVRRVGRELLARAQEARGYVCMDGSVMVTVNRGKRSTNEPHTCTNQTESNLFFLRLDYDKSPNTFRAYGFTGVPAIIHVRLRLTCPVQRRRPPPTDYTHTHLTIYTQPPKPTTRSRPTSWLWARPRTGRRRTRSRAATASPCTPATLTRSRSPSSWRSGQVRAWVVGCVWCGGRVDGGSTDTVVWLNGTERTGVEISIYKSPMPIIIFMLSLLAVLALSAKHLINIIPWALQKASRGGAYRMKGKDAPKLYPLTYH